MSTPRLHETQVSSGNPWQPRQSAQPEHEELAGEIFEDLSRNGFVLQRHMRPYGGGFAQGFESFFWMTHPDKPNERLGVYPVVEQWAQSLPESEVEQVNVSSIVGWLAILNSAEQHKAS